MPVRCERLDGGRARNPSTILICAIVIVTSLLAVPRATGQSSRDVIIQISPSAAPDAIAELRGQAGVERIRRVPTLGSEVWRVPTQRASETLVRATRTPGVGGADYAGSDYRSLFLRVAPGTLSPAQSAALAAVQDSGLSDVRVVRLRAGDLGARMLLNGFDEVDGLPNGSVLLELDGGAPAVVTRDEVTLEDDRHFQWSGELTMAGASPRAGRAAFSVEGENILGLISSGTEEYSVRPIGGGLHAIGRINRADFPPDHPPASVDDAAEAGDPMPFSMLQSQSTGSPAIAVSVAYTARAAAGIRLRYGVEPEHLIRHAVHLTNQSLDFSQVGTRVQLSGVQETAGTESGDFVADVNSLVAPADGRFDELPVWRRHLRANAVILLVGMDGACGQASRVFPPARATYALVNYACAVDNKSFAHELGHLLGMRHDPDADASNHPFPYGHGYRHPNMFRTIMAEGSEMRLWAWSNPNIRWQGVPMGTTDRHHDARAISEMAPIFSGYFGE